MKIAAKVTYNHIPQIAEQIGPRMGVVVRKTVLFIERRSKELMEGPKSGRVYTRGAITRSAKGRQGKGLIAQGARSRKGRVTVGYKYHRASAPGEAPAVDTGVLRGSIQGEMTGRTSGIVFTNLVYSWVLEFGGRRIKARPFFKPASAEGGDFFLQMAQQELGKLK